MQPQPVAERMIFNFHSYSAREKGCDDYQWQFGPYRAQEKGTKKFYSVSGEHVCWTWFVLYLYGLSHSYDFIKASRIVLSVIPRNIIRCAAYTYVHMYVCCTLYGIHQFRNTTRCWMLRSNMSVMLMLMLSHCVYCSMGRPFGPCCVKKMAESMKHYAFTVLYVCLGMSDIIQSSWTSDFFSPLGFVSMRFWRIAFIYSPMGIGLA